MRKRERENPCGFCGHYHKYEEGEVCGVCGHRPALAAETTAVPNSAFPSEILKDFLFLGSYDNASRNEILRTMGISHILNTVPSCQTLYKNSFTYHCLQDGNNLEFDNAIQFLEQCQQNKVRVLVHCMSGKNRSPAIVIAYLMKCKGWRLGHSLQWVKDRRPSVNLSPAVSQQLLEYEQKIFGSVEPSHLPPFPSAESPNPVGFGFPRPAETAAPIFNHSTSSSVFDRMGASVSEGAFVFGAQRNDEHVITEGNSFGITLPGVTPMDSFWTFGAP